jgi:uncharacterized protein
MKLVVLIVLVVLGVWLIRRALTRSAGKKEAGKPMQASGGELVRCAHCGVHLPRSEARQTEGVLYCSEEHARLGRR